MFYSQKITIPQHTLENNPLKETIIVDGKYLTMIEITLDIVATKGLVGIKIIGGEPVKQVFAFPKNSDGWIYKSILLTEKVKMSENPERFPINILAISPNATCPHDIIVEIQTSNE